MYLNKNFSRLLNSNILTSARFWFLIVALVFVTRMHQRILFADFWAEDGTVFVADAFNYGLKSFFLSHAGYFHTIPRIISFISTFLPVIMIPHFITIMTLFPAVFVFTTFLREDYAYLIPNLAYRGIVCIILCFASGLPEIAGNMANLHWLCWLYLGLLGVTDLRKKYQVWELILAFFCIVSEGAVVSLIPLFGCRLIFHLVQKKSLYYIFGEVFLILLIIISSVINFQVRLADVENFSFEFMSVLIIFIRTFVSNLLFQPWLSNSLNRASVSVNMITGAFTISIIVFFIKGKIQFKHIPFLVLIGSSVMTYLLISLVRTGADKLFLGLNGTWWSRSRYGFIIGTASILFWSFIFWIIFHKKQKILATVITILSIFVMTKYHVILKPFIKGQNSEWIARSIEIKNCLQTGDPQSITMNIQPEGWRMTIQTKLQKSE